MKDSRTSNVFKNSGASIIYKLSHIVVQFVIRTTFVYLLGKEYTGISSLFMDVLSVLSLMDLGMATALVFSLYKPLAEGDKKRITALMGFYKKAYRIIGCLIIGVGVLCTPFLKYIVTDVPNIKEDIRVLFIMYVLTSAASYFLVYKTVLLRANQQARVISAVNSIAEIVECAIEVILLLIFKEFFAYLIVRLIGAVARNIILSRITEKRFPEYLAEDKSCVLSKEDKKSMFKDIFALGIYKVSGVMIYSTPSIIISAFVSTAEVAVIGSFTMITNSLRTAIEQIVESTKASIGNLAATATKEKQEQVFNTMNFISFAVSCFCCTCMFVLLNPFVSEIWFDESYAVATKIVAVLTVNFFIAVMVYPVESFRTANGLFVQGKWRPAIMAVLNVVLSILFVRWWGVFGVFLASLVSRVSTQVWFDAYLVYKHVFGKTPWKYYLEYLKMFGIVALSSASAYLLSNIIPIGNVFLGFIFKCVISASVPLAFIFVFYGKTSCFEYAKNMVLRIVRKKLKRA